MDAGRINFENYNGVLYCDAMMNDEFSVSDLEAIRHEIQNNYSSAANVIYKRSGTYSVTSDAQMILWKGIADFMNFIYVIDHESMRNTTRYAVETYMHKYNARIANTKEEAYAMLSKNSWRKTISADQAIHGLAAVHHLNKSLHHCSNIFFNFF